MSRTPLVATGLALALAASATVSQAATWSDTFIGYRYGSSFHEPGNGPLNGKDVRKNILQFNHVSGFSLGQNFVNLDVFQSNKDDPSSGDGKNGATEFYLTYRNQLYFSKLFDRSFAFGPVKDIALSSGFDLNTKNTTFAPRKRQLFLGPTLKFDVPKGFVDLTLYWTKEWNHCGIDPCKAPGNKTNIAFDPTYQLSLTWGLPFEVASLPLKFQGFLNQNGKKGRDNLNAHTDTERLMRTSLMLDVGQLAWGSKNQFWAGVGYESWYHKFGNYKNLNGTKKKGINSDVPMLQLEWHL